VIPLSQRPGLNTFNDFKEMDRLPTADGFSAIQNNSDLPQGLKPAIGGIVDRKDSRHRDASLESKRADQGAGDPRFDWAT
jgi:hypothetical protein